MYLYVCGRFHQNQQIIKFTWLLKGLSWSMSQIYMSTCDMYTKMHAVSNHLVKKQKVTNISPSIPIVMSIQASILVSTTLERSCRPQARYMPALILSMLDYCYIFLIDINAPWSLHKDLLFTNQYRFAQVYLRLL